MKSTCQSYEQRQRGLFCVQLNTGSETTL